MRPNFGIGYERGKARRRVDAWGPSRAGGRLGDRHERVIVCVEVVQTLSGKMNFDYVKSGNVSNGFSVTF